MKYSILKTIAFPLAAAMFFSCDNADYQEVQNGLYINEAAPSDKSSQQIENLTVKGTTTATIHVRLAQEMTKDVHATIEIADEFVTEYNERFGTSYKTLPAEYLKYEKDVTIPAGNISSEAIKIEIAPYSSDDGQAYCLPLKVISNDADVRVMTASSRIIYILTSPNTQVVPMMNTNTVPHGAGSWGVSTSEWTLEGWIWMSAFPINNQAIFNAEVSKGIEIYVRFGDANVPYNVMQIKTGGSQFESNTTFSPNTWYHVAITYAAGKCTLYVNGAEDASKDVSTDYVIENLQLCSSGSWFRCNAQMAQVRFWSKALSASVIKDGMDKNISADAGGLIGYWKLNDGSGDVFKDSSPNGRDLTCTNSPTWSTGKVDFSEPNK